MSGVMLGDIRFDKSSSLGRSSFSYALFRSQRGADGFM